MSITKIKSQQQFEDLINNSSNYIFVDFSASWCGPCKRIYPKLEELSKKYPLVTFLYVDIDQNKDLAHMYDISSVPTFLAFQSGNIDPKFNAIMGANVTQIEMLLQILSTANDNSDSFSSSSVDSENNGNNSIVKQMLNEYKKM